MASKDSRRILGPEKSLPYSILQKKEKKQFLREDGSRHDGRSPADPRKFCKSKHHNFLILIGGLQESVA